MSSSSGVSAAVRCALWLEDERACDVLAIGRESFAPMQPADAAFPPELLLTVGDGAEGWRTVRQSITALERSGLAKLQPRPLHVGGTGPNAWVIE